MKSNVHVILYLRRLALGILQSHADLHLMGLILDDILELDSGLTKQPERKII